MDRTKKERRRKSLSLKKRIEVIEASKTRTDSSQLEQIFPCGRAQLFSILLQKESIPKEWTNKSDQDHVCRLATAFGSAINKVIYEWINRCRCAQIPLTDIAIIEKACKVKKFFKYCEFTPNPKWLERFKNHFQIHKEQLEKIDPSMYDGIERSLKIRDIYEDLKETLDSSVIVAVAERLGTGNRTKLLNNKNTDSNIKIQDNLKNDPANNNLDCDICEISDSDDQSSQSVIFGKAQTDEENDLDMEEKVISYKEEAPLPIQNKEPIRDVTQALECLKRLEEYSMLREDFRAIGLIDQLEKLYKGQLEF